MRRSILLKVFSLATLLSTLIFCGAANAVSCSDFNFQNGTWIVNGTNNNDTDRANITTVLDCAKPGDTILLKGNFQIGKFVDPAHPDAICNFDSPNNPCTCVRGGGANPCDPVQPFINITKSGITIKGDKTNGSWNTVITGLKNANGSIPGQQLNGFLDGFLKLGPVGERCTPQPDGHVICPSINETLLTDITIKDLKIVDMSRAIWVSPQVDALTGLCSDSILTTGNAKRITINNNWFDHSARAIQGLGAMSDVDVENNIMHNNQREAVYFNGFGTSCNGGFGFFYFGNPKHVSIARNLITNDIGFAPGFVGLRSAETEQTTISGNTLIRGPSSFGFGILLSSTNNNVVEGNEITNPAGGAQFFGIASTNIFLTKDPNGQGPDTTNLQINNNNVHDVGLGLGIYVDSSTTGNKIKCNQFSNNPSGDIYLAGTTSLIRGAGFTPSFENSVKAALDTVVFDNGVNNKIKFKNNCNDE